MQIRRGWRLLLPCLAALSVGLLLASAAGAQTSIWTGTGDWFADTGNWAGGVPGAGFNVLIASGSVTLTNDSTMLGSFTMSSGTLTFSNLAAVVQAHTCSHLRIHQLLQEVHNVRGETNR